MSIVDPEMDTAECLVLHCSEPIRKLWEKFGVVGGWVGVLKGDRTHIIHHGVQKLAAGPIEAHMKSDNDALYFVSSITKPYIAAALGVLITEKKNFRFDTPVEDIVPTLKDMTKDGGGDHPLTVGDLLDHRTRFFRSDLLWEDSFGKIMLETEEQVIDLLSKLPFNKGPTSWEHKLNYTNLGLVLAAIVIEKKINDPPASTRTTWPEYLRDKVLKPTSMVRSTADLTQRDLFIIQLWAATARSWPMTRWSQ